ncbi:MAG TPA: carboxymuconolactone decarboxylase family protein [Kribbella sp.]|nr:carboxymuconolactone decarboxylase family protein [Kribbella sp.]
MSRIALPHPQTATGKLKASFDAIRARFGTVPNGLQAMGASPEALHGFLEFSTSLAAGSITRAERERIAVLTAQRNECGYCLSAHTLGGRAAGLTEVELRASRKGFADEPRAAALLRLADAVIEHRGNIPDTELAAARNAGLTDSEVVEVVAEVSLNTFTNYLNRLVHPEFDIPRVSMDEDAVA